MKQVKQLFACCCIMALLSGGKCLAQTCTATAPVCVATGNQPAFQYSANTNFRLQFNDSPGVSEYQFTNNSGNKVFGVNAVNGNISLGNTGALQVAANRAAFQFSGDPDAGLFFTGGSPNQYQFRSLSGANVFTIDEDDGDLACGHIGVGASPTIANQIFAFRPIGEFGPNMANIHAHRGGSLNNDSTGGTSWSRTGVDAAIKAFSDWGNPYSAAVHGTGVLDYENSAAIFGGSSSGTTFGALGFRDANQIWGGFFDGDVRIQDGKLDMENANDATSIFVQNNYAGSLLKIGMDIRLDAGGNGGKYGLRTIVTPDATSNAWGAFLDVSRIGNTGTLYGLHASVSGPGTTTGTNYGIRARTLDGTSPVSYGIRSTAEGVGSSTVHYGVYGWATGAATNWAGYFSGAVFGTSYTTSDRKLKKDIKPMDGALDLIMKLEPKTYEYDHETYDFMTFPEGKQYGLIAQDLDKVIPGLTKEAAQPKDETKDDLGPDDLEHFLAVNYTPLISIAVKGIQEQQVSIEDLEETILAKDEAIEDLQREMAQLKDMMKDMNNALSQCCLSSTQPVESGMSAGEDKVMPGGQSTGDSDEPVLGQNVPNPFDQTTTIKYYVPETTQSAFIHISDMKGELVKQFKLGSGNGQVTFQSSDLSAGAYVYSMVNDGQVIATRKMILR